MKKALVILLALSMVACMFACAPAAEAPAAAAPVAEEPAAQEPAAEEPAAQEPAAEEPAAQEPAGDVTLAFNVKNKYKSAEGESLQMKELYLYVKGSEDRGENLLGDVPQINSSEYSDYVRIVCVRPAATDYEAYAVFTNADGSITEEGAFKNLQMMEKNSLSFKSEGEVSCKADEDVSFTDELLADALADGSTFKALATIAFTLKNKTDVTINELYVYPTGAADKGSNILEAPMISSGEDADYLHPIIMRERVATYDVTVILEDGTEFSIPGLDMDNATKLSLKAADGSDFSIDTILTLEEEGDQEGIDEFYGYFTEDLVKPLQNGMVSCH